MSDATGAAAAALAGGDNSTVTTPAAGATGTTAPATTPPADATGAAVDTWTKGFDPADAGIVEKKGWKSPQDLYKSYRELETKLGADKLILPKEGADAKEWDPIYNKLGRPESPDKYKFPDGVDADTVKALAPELHKLGITQTQAEALAKIDLARSTQAQEQYVAAVKADSDKTMAKLQDEWGQKTPEQIEHNRRAMRALGISVDQAEKYMAAGGAEKFMRLLNAAGKSMREEGASVLSGDDSDLGFGMTTNRAAAELADLKVQQGIHG
jgi:hypothetical protein